MELLILGLVNIILFNESKNIYVSYQHAKMCRAWALELISGRHIRWQFLLYATPTPELSGLRRWCYPLYICCLFGCRCRRNRAEPTPSVLASRSSTASSTITILDLTPERRSPSLPLWQARSGLRQRSGSPRQQVPDGRGTRRRKRVGLAVDGDPAERASGAGRQPCVDAPGVEPVAAAGQEPRLLPVLEPGQAHRALQHPDVVRRAVYRDRQRAQQLCADASRRGHLGDASAEQVAEEDEREGDEDEEQREEGRRGEERVHDMRTCGWASEDALRSITRSLVYRYMYACGGSTVGRWATLTWWMDESNRGERSCMEPRAWRRVNSPNGAIRMRDDGSTVHACSWEDSQGFLYHTTRHTLHRIRSVLVQISNLHLVYDSFKIVTSPLVLKTPEIPAPVVQTCSVRFQHDPLNRSQTFGLSCSDAAWCPRIVAVYFRGTPPPPPFFILSDTVAPPAHKFPSFSPRWRMDPYKKLPETMEVEDPE